MKKRIGYIFFILILFFLYIWTNKKMTLWACILFVGMAFLSILINQLIVRKISIKYEIIQNINIGKNCIQIIVENKGIFPANHIENVIRCENIVFGTSDRKSIHISVPAKSIEEFILPISSRYCGRIDLFVEKCCVYDWFDLTYRTVKVHKEGCYYSYPKEKFQPLEKINDGISEGEEITYKHVVGNDVSEILQIREYRQGDSIKNIHWKLSAKSSKILIKELDCPNDNSILVLFDYAKKEERDTNNNILTAVSNISNQLMKERKGHTVYRMDTSEEHVVDRIVEEPEEFDIMQQELLETEAKTIGRKVAEYIMDTNIFKQYAKIIYVKAKNDEDYSGIEELENCIVVEM